MFISETMVKSLKKVNISVDADKTKARLSSLWKGASREDRLKILALTGLVKASIQRAYTTGAISAKLVVAVSQVMGVNPYYLTGASDEKEGCTKERIYSLLEAHGYGKLLKAQKNKQASFQAGDMPAMESNLVTPQAWLERRKDTHAGTPPMNSVLSGLYAFLKTTIPQETQAFMEDMSEEDMTLLMRSILIRARAGEEGADLARLLKFVLMQ